MDDPIVFFENSKDISKQLAKNQEKALEWEQVKTSKYSPGIVKNDETVVRQIFSPIHVDEETGEVKTAAFDDASNKGLSVNRLAHASPEDIHQSGEKKADTDRKSGKEDRAYLGFVEADVEKIRSDLEDNTRVFTVYDTALKKAIHHGDVCTIKQNDCQIPKLSKKLAKKERRLRLQRKFSTLQKNNN